jgi:antitoxin (DNA-binding transcriptional repressor) of toxin-antitoxin stability system
MQIAADQPITPSHSAPRWRFHAAAHDRPGSRRHLRKEMIQNASGSLDEQELGASAAAHSIPLVDYAGSVRRELVMRQVNMHEAKTHLSRLVEEAAAGAGFVICKAGRPMVRVSPLSEPMVAPLPRRRLGLLQGHCSVPDDFDQLGSDTMADLFEGL